MLVGGGVAARAVVRAEGELVVVVLMVWWWRVREVARCWSSVWYSTFSATRGS